MRPSELGNFRKIATSKVKQTNNYNKKGERYEQYYISKAMLCRYSTVRVTPLSKRRRSFNTGKIIVNIILSVFPLPRLHSAVS